jgi:hypothetical protein
MVLDPENKIMKKIKRAVTAEVKSTDDEKLLFRMDSKATKKVISFMTAVGLEYLEKALGTIIRKICEGTRAALTTKPYILIMTRTAPATRSTAEL